jgi:hypothetical protein
LNQDGKVDIIAALQSTQAGKLALYTAGRDKNAFWTEHTIQRHITHMHGLAIGDFDIFAANRSGPVDHHADILLWRNNQY